MRRGVDVAALIAWHLQDAAAKVPPDNAFALDAAGLADPAITLWTARAEGALLGMAALRHLSDEHGEVQSMRTASGHGRRGVGRALLMHMIAEAQRRGYRRLSLETGSGEKFAPAHALYESSGFLRSGPFGSYRESQYNFYYTQTL